MSAIQLVWFKRDLRVYDHAPLFMAAQTGSVLPLYILEPALWQQPDASLRQWRFIRQSLRELDAALRELGARRLLLRVAVFEKHGSRKKPITRHSDAPKASPTTAAQLALFDEH